jgi:hypothetical protein
MSCAGDDALVDVDDGGPAPCEPGRAVFTNSLAMLLPVSTALFNTLAARFMNPTVSAIALADTFPARS